MTETNAPQASRSWLDRYFGLSEHGTSVRLELVALNHVFGDEPKEGIASFQEKRKPDWRKFRGGEGPDPAG